MRAIQTLRRWFRRLFRKSATPSLRGLERKWLTVHSTVPAKRRNDLLD